ncbi:hypothetical protein JTE90_027046 [Oedothorax gibbosus]|uniref:Uncharacterized protein n=1 Tax=Oedothorax gibbosus TaxID=931172 RepID=A0AAV6UV10_9ARAC|nr:hypothetical protein JTE90_027046 [Oedothorax gibbosus]
MGKRGLKYFRHSSTMQSTIHRLEGSAGNEVGGLILQKKKDDNGLFKVPAPKKSLLGLDTLAEKRRREKEAEQRQEKEDEGRSHKKKYRTSKDETPTHTGGVSKEYLDRADQRHKRDKERGIYTSSKHRRDRQDKESRRDSERSHRSKGSSSRRRNESYRDEPPSPRIHARDSPSR